VAAPKMPLEQAPFGELIRKAAAKYNVDADLVFSVVAAESNFNPKAISRRNDPLHPRWLRKILRDSQGRPQDPARGGHDGVLARARGEPFRDPGWDEEVVADTDDFCRILGSG